MLTKATRARSPQWQAGETRFQEMIRASPQFYKKWMWQFGPIINVERHIMEKWQSKTLKASDHYDYRLFFLSVHMCASDEGKDSCQGDSGGPLFYKENGRLWTKKSNKSILQLNSFFHQIYTDWCCKPWRAWEERTRSSVCKPWQAWSVRQSVRSDSRVDHEHGIRDSEEHLWPGGKG